ncbi:MAG TPA: selenide, water dikinase SelD [Thermomicrobiales bacterium]|jgi:selenide,water dikinase|nr:selenide, water dikinase SelD [Thermomicrobiales bacterium]
MTAQGSIASATLAAGGGCAAKMSPSALSHLIARSGLADQQSPDVLVGLGTSDDAAVIRTGPETAIVQTVDFFPPVVDDPHLFGRIAAANAMSDVWAMGGDVLSALAILTVPEDANPSVGAVILAGAREAVAAGGGVIVGGHTVYDPGVKFGLAVTGTVHPDRFWTKATACPGDVLVLTKPVGTALVMTAHRAGAAPAGAYQSAVESMVRLNRRTSEIARSRPPRACTDVTGFGLLGHLAEMVVRSGTGAVVHTGSVPVLPGALEAAKAGFLCAGLGRNRASWEEEARSGIALRYGETDEALIQAFWDPNTSGGLLLAIDPQEADDVVARLIDAGEPAGVIGAMTDAGDIRLHP